MSGTEPQSIASAPRTDTAEMVAKPFLGWCPDVDSPNGGDWRVCWWEPRLNGHKGTWWGDRDIAEEPIAWLPLPAPLGAAS